MITDIDQQVERFQQNFTLVSSEIGKRIVGYEDLVEGILTSLLASGHVLLEGIPGLGKTRLVHTLSDVLHLKFARVQFTPDLMPADIIGTNVVQEGQHGEKFLEFQQGPLFANIVLADEINRATPKTQSALLEAMQEQTVSVGKKTYKLKLPFFVLATQNPLEMEGTYPLPEAQLDRFFLKLKVSYPDVESLHKILDRTTQTDEPEVNRVLTGDQLLDMRRTAREVPIARPIQEVRDPTDARDASRLGLLAAARQQVRSLRREPAWRAGVGGGRKDPRPAGQPGARVVRGRAGDAAAGAPAPGAAQLRGAKPSRSIPTRSSRTCWRTPPSQPSEACLLVLHGCRRRRCSMGSFSRNSNTCTSCRSGRSPVSSVRSVARGGGGRGWNSPITEPTRRVTTFGVWTGAPTSGLNKLLLRLFEEEQDLPIYLFVDCSRSMADGRPTKLAYACQVAAALCYIGLAHLDRVTLAPYTDSPGPGAAVAARQGGKFSRCFAF